jgi:hypothetical protein
MVPKVQNPIHSEENCNTRYFHNVVNDRRKKLIHTLKEDEGTIEGHEQPISLNITPSGST